MPRSSRTAFEQKLVRSRQGPREGDSARAQEGPASLEGDRDRAAGKQAAKSHQRRRIDKERPHGDSHHGGDSNRRASALRSRRAMSRLAPQASDPHHLSIHAGGGGSAAKGERRSSRSALSGTPPRARCTASRDGNAHVEGGRPVSIPIRLPAKALGKETRGLGRNSLEAPAMPRSS